MNESRNGRRQGTPGGVEAVDRATSLLACFREGDASLTLSELSARTGFYKSTILRLAASLEQAGLLVRLNDKGYVVGPEAMRLGSIYQNALRIEDHVRPVLRRLLQVTGESASLFRREGDRRVCLFREDSIHSIRDHVTEGATLPLTNGAAGHVLRLFDGCGDPAGGRTLPDLPVFSYGERDREIAAAAVPVFWRRASRIELLGALTLSGPIGRFNERTGQGIAMALLDEGRKLSVRLGGSYDHLPLPQASAPEPDEGPGGPDVSFGAQSGP